MKYSTDSSSSDELDSDAEKILKIFSRSAKKDKPENLMDYGLRKLSVDNIFLIRTPDAQRLREARQWLIDNDFIREDGIGSRHCAYRLTEKGARTVQSF